MELTITQNGAAYALQHGVPKKYRRVRLNECAQTRFGLSRLINQGGDKTEPARTDQEIRDYRRGPLPAVIRGMAFFNRDENAAARRAHFPSSDQCAFNRRANIG